MGKRAVEQRHTAHAPTPFSLLINLSFLALSKTERLQSLAISVDDFVVRRNCKSCCLLMLCKSLCYSMENISTFQSDCLSFMFRFTFLGCPGCPAPWQKTAVCVCLAAPCSMDKQGDVHFTVLAPDHHLCEHEHCLCLYWNSPLLQGLFNHYVHLYLLLVPKGWLDSTCFGWLQWEL